MSKKVSSKFWVSLALEGSMGGIYGADGGKYELKSYVMDERRREMRTYVAFIIYMRPVTGKKEEKKKS